MKVQYILFLFFVVAVVKAADNEDNADIDNKKPEQNQDVEKIEYADVSKDKDNHKNNENKLEQVTKATSKPSPKVKTTVKAQEDMDKPTTEKKPNEENSLENSGSEEDEDFFTMVENKIEKIYNSLFGKSSSKNHNKNKGSDCDHEIFNWF